MIEEGTRIVCNKKGIRINLRHHSLVDISQPNKKNDGFDYSENFDGMQIVNKKRFYINLKRIVGEGGSQNRSLREVYWFIQGQLRCLDKYKNIYFVNILDGDKSHSVMDKFKYLLSLEKEEIRERIYVGDLRDYFTWFETKSSV